MPMTPPAPSRMLTDLLPSRIVVAPMAGGPSTAELVIAAARAGALGFLAAGYKTPAAMAAEMAAVRAATSEPFGVNVFVPGLPSPDREALDRYLDALRENGPLSEATWDDDGFDGKIAALLADPGVQRPPGAWPGQPVHPRLPGGARGLPRDQQRHPPAAGRCRRRR